MDAQRLLLAGLLTLATGGGLLHGQTGQPLTGEAFLRDAINTKAVTTYFDPPARHSDTKWELVKLEACQVELKETWHRESPNSVFLAREMLSRVEDRTTTYTFDLRLLRRDEIMADTSTGLAQIKIFADADLFHVKTDTVSTALRADGSVADSTAWTMPGHTRNLWIYFDSPEADNKALVRRVAAELQAAADKCLPPVTVLPKRSPKMEVAAALRQLTGNPK